MMETQLGLTQLSVTSLNGVGNKIAEKLARLNIYSVADLLFHLPIRYEDRTRITKIAELKVGNHVLVEGNVRSSVVIRKQKANLICQIGDDTGILQLRFFHFTMKQQQLFNKSGLTLRCFGEIRRNFKSGELEIIHPEIQIISSSIPAPLSDRLTPIYPTTEGLHQLSLRKLTEQGLELLNQQEALPELFPKEILEQLQMMPLHDALHYVHRPPVNAPQALLISGKHPSQQRLAFEELVAHQVSLQQIRFQVRKHQAPALNHQGKLRKKLLQALPFQLTHAQKRVLQEILEDLKKDYPMLRLVQGDVGSGKTVVSALAMLQAIEQGYQAVLMAPTELLAEQHLKNFQNWFSPLNIEIAWLTGSLQGKNREAILEKIKSGKTQVVIGTHALFQQDVNFNRLALLVIDEQHRFGVHQRLALRDKGKFESQYPHQLIMTATPIPRTLAMTAYADLDCSVIDELPPGRKPITTILISQTRRVEIIERVRANCLKKRQAYWVCTLIEESEALQCQAAEATAKELQTLLPELVVEMVHGRMKSDQRNHVMQQFQKGEIDLLVSTTVIEVGVDIANASLMVIENPERLGLAQLHQLRGRVGRKEQESHCVLLYKMPLSRLAKERLMTMRSSQDGFEIARKDLEIRGPGEVLGTKQSGLLELKIADIVRDQSLLSSVQEVGKVMIKKYPERIILLLERWINERKKYACV